MKLPGDYKRNYRFRSDTSKEQRYLTLIIVAVILIAILMYFL